MKSPSPQTHMCFIFHLTWGTLYFALSQGLTPYEFVEGMKKKGIRVAGIGHRYSVCSF